MKSDCRHGSLLRARLWTAGLLVLCAIAIAPPLAAVQPPAQPPAHAPGERAGEAQSAEEHAAGLLPTIAKVVNFALLAGLLMYFLKSPLMTYLATRGGEIRQDLVTASEMRRAAAEQLAEIDRKMKALPAELEALKQRGEEDIRAEHERIAEAMAGERARLLDHMRREIDMRLRVARRELVAHAAQLAISVAERRITRSMTPEDHLRLVDRYTNQLEEAR